MTIPAAMQHEILCGRSRVVNAARHLFATRGFHQTGMAELAEEADVSVGAIYRCFKGKADIIQAIVEENARVRLAELGELSARVKGGALSVEAALIQVAHVALAAGNEGLSFEIFAEAHRNPGVAATIAGLCDHYRAVFRDLACAANPQLTETELNAAEELLLACMFGLGHRNLSRPRLDVAETARCTARMVLHALHALHPLEGAPCAAAGSRAAAKE